MDLKKPDQLRDPSESYPDGETFVTSDAHCRNIVSQVFDALLQANYRVLHNLCIHIKAIVSAIRKINSKVSGLRRGYRPWLR